MELMPPFTLMWKFTLFLNFEIFSWKASSFKQNKTNKRNYPFLYSPFLFRNLDLQRHMQYWKSILLTDHMPYAYEQ